MNNRYKELLKQVSIEHNEVKDESLNDRVLILDGLNQFIRCFGAVPALNDDGEHCGGVTGFSPVHCLNNPYIKTHSCCRGI